MVGHTYNYAFLDWGRETETQGQSGINSELQMSVCLKWYSSAYQAWTPESNSRITKKKLLSSCSFFVPKKKPNKYWSHSLILIILGSQEATIRRIVVQIHHMHNCSPDPIWKELISKKKGWKSASSSKNTCLASMTLSVQTSVPHPKKNRIPKVCSPDLCMCILTCMLMWWGALWIHMCISIW
jgi:hypothetical protein